VPVTYDDRQLQRAAVEAGPPSSDPEKTRL